jgi:hypothetical protein
MTLTREQELALVEALGHDGNVSMVDEIAMLELGLARRSRLPHVVMYPQTVLTPAGRIVAQLIKERDEARGESLQFRELLTDANAVISNQKRALDWSNQEAQKAKSPPAETDGV